MDEQVSQANAVLISERTAEESPPGHARRIESLTEHYEMAGYSVEVIALQAGRGSKLQRAVRVVTARDVWARASSADLAVVSGLGAPHMMVIARRLARRVRVVFDCCGSWTLQARARAAEGAPRLPILAGALIMRLPSRIDSFSYIHERDVLADRHLLRKSAHVVPQRRVAELAGLGQVEYPLARVVIPADFTSFHNRVRAEDVLNRTARVASRNANVRFEVYGRVPSDFTLPSRVEKMGWVADLTSLYSGSTGVIVTNHAGSGLPNKLLEAIQANRPVVLHESFRFLSKDLPAHAYFFRAPAELEVAIQAMIDGRTPTKLSPDSSRFRVQSSRTV